MKNNRKQLIVDGNFQFRFILIGVLTSFLLINTSIIFGYWVSPMIKVEASPDVVLAVVMAIIEMLCVITIFVVTLKTSHRIAGPLSQMKKNLQKMGEGDLTTFMHIRQNDNFHDLCDQFNETSQKLHSRIEQIKETTTKLDREMEHKTLSKETLDHLNVQLDEFLTSSTVKNLEEQNVYPLSAIK